MAEHEDAESYCRGFRLRTGQPLIMHMGEACFFARNGVNIPGLVKDGDVHVVSLKVGEETDMRPVEKAYGKRRVLNG
jgi:hypothetical protein